MSAAARPIHAEAAKARRADTLRADALRTTTASASRRKRVRPLFTGDRARLVIKHDSIGGQGEPDPAFSGGLGRSLMDGLAGQLSGTLTVRHEPGTEVVVEFTIDRTPQLKSKAVEPAPAEE